MVRDMQDDIEPLPSEEWFERIEMIANGELGSTENALRHAMHLLQLAPPEFRPSGYEAIDEETYEALLAAGDLEGVARRLVAVPTLAVATNSIPDGVEAAIRCKILNLTIFGKGDSAAAAILQAWTNCLFDVRAKFDANLLSVAVRP